MKKNKDKKIEPQFNIQNREFKLHDFEDEVCKKFNNDFKNTYYSFSSVSNDSIKNIFYAAIDYVLSKRTESHTNIFKKYFNKNNIEVVYPSCNVSNRIIFIKYNTKLLFKFQLYKWTLSMDSYCDSDIILEELVYRTLFNYYFGTLRCHLSYNSRYINSKDYITRYYKPHNNLFNTLFFMKYRYCRSITKTYIQYMLDLPLENKKEVFDYLINII